MHSCVHALLRCIELSICQECDNDKQRVFHKRCHIGQAFFRSWVRRHCALLQHTRVLQQEAVALDTFSSTNFDCSSEIFVPACPTGKQGLVIDERTNGGGCVADYVLDMLSRYPYGYFNRRDHKSYPVRLQSAPSSMDAKSRTDGGCATDSACFDFRYVSAAVALRRFCEHHQLCFAT